MTSNNKNLSWMSSNIIVKETQGGEHGVFAKKAIQKDTLLMIFGGHIMTRNQEKELPEKIRDAGIQIDKDFVIGANCEDEITGTDFVNHSCNPNAYIRGQVSLYTLKDIESGEEITFDYGTVLFGSKKNPTYKIKCYCHSKDCRKVITDHDWKIPQFQKKNKNRLPFYITDAIKVNKKT
jgi:SET domain-containing protein